MTDARHAEALAFSAAHEIAGEIQRRREGNRSERTPDDLHDEARGDIEAICGWLVLDIGSRAMIQILVREAGRIAERAEMPPESFLAEVMAAVGALMVEQGLRDDDAPGGGA